MARLDFWFEFASTYTYLSAMRLGVLARDAGVTIRWRPFLLGPIFRAQGWDSSPFNIFPAKGRYMWCDLDRQAAEYDLPPITRPSPFPQNGLLAARVAMAGQDAPWIPDFVRAVFKAQFAEGRQIGDPAVIAALLAELDLDPALIGQADGDAVKSALRAQTLAAQDAGIFGAPSFVTEDGELFWGDDRLEQALAWAAGRGHRLARPL